MIRKCIGCGKDVNGYKDGYELPQANWICKECGQLVGITNFMSAGFCSKEKFLKKYVKVKPEAQGLLDKCREDKERAKAEFKKELSEMHEKAVKHSGCKEMKQEKYTCSSCGNIWYIGDVDHLKNLYNASTGNFFTINQLKDVSQCPKCGSRASSHKTVKYWVDKKGNCVDTEE
jgi:rubrerythrin